MMVLAFVFLVSCDDIAERPSLDKTPTSAKDRLRQSPQKMASPSTRTSEELVRKHFLSDAKGMALQGISSPLRTKGDFVVGRGLGGRYPLWFVFAGGPVAAINGHAITITPHLDRRTDPLSSVLLDFAVDFGLTGSFPPRTLEGRAFEELIQEHRIKENEALDPELLSLSEKEKAKEALLKALPSEWRKADISGPSLAKVGILKIVVIRADLGGKTALFELGNPVFSFTLPPSGLNELGASLLGADLSRSAYDDSALRAMREAALGRRHSSPPG